MVLDERSSLPFKRSRCLSTRNEPKRALYTDSSRKRSNEESNSNAPGVESHNCHTARNKRHGTAQGAQEVRAVSADENARRVSGTCVDELHKHVRVLLRLVLGLLLLAPLVRCHTRRTINELRQSCRLSLKLKTGRVPQAIHSFSIRKQKPAVVRKYGSRHT